MSELPPLRRPDKHMAEPECRELLRTAFCGRLATVGPDGYPYVVPLLFVWMDGEVWVHNTRAVGHLRRNVDHAPKVCFEVDQPGEIFPYGPSECDTSVAYRSVVCFGRIRVVTAPEDKTRFCDALMTKYWPARGDRTIGDFPRLDQITVYAIELDRITGKQNPMPRAAAQEEH